MKKKLGLLPAVWGDNMPYCNVKIKSTIKEGRNYARMDSEGRIDSDIIEAARNASVNLGNSVEIANKKTYDCHIRSR